LTTPPSSATHVSEWAAAARTGGAVITLGYLLGIAPGPVVAVVGGLGLITFGRALTADRLHGAFLGATLAILAGVLGVPALRWGALDLGGIRGVQAFFGPTVLVEPVSAAAASWVAAICGLVAVAMWIGPPPRLRSLDSLMWVFEAGLASFAIVTAFWGEAIVGWGEGSGSVWAGVGRWALIVTVAAVGAALLAWASAKLARRWQWVALAVAGVAVLVSAAVTASAVQGVV
jgi:hypothetical protein